MEIAELVRVIKKDGIKLAELQCKQCGELRTINLNGVKGNIKRGKYTGFCKKCSYANRQGWKDPELRARRVRNGYGYIRIRISRDDFFYPMVQKIGYVLEHRLVMARHLRRLLHSWEHVHHKNGKRDDNRIENLEITTNSRHMIDHHKGYADGFAKGLVDGQRNADRKEVDKRLQQMALNYNTIIECNKAEHRKGVEEIFEEMEEHCPHVFLSSRNIRKWDCYLCRQVLKQKVLKEESDERTN